MAICEIVFTYQTRISGNEDTPSVYANLFSVLRRRQFAEVSAGDPIPSLKPDYILGVVIYA